jgi:hypothetical protein
MGVKNINKIYFTTNGIMNENRVASEDDDNRS